MLTVDLERLGAGPGEQVLDAGCGQGRHSVALRRLGCRVIGLDLNRADLKYARYLLLHQDREEMGKDPGAGESTGGWLVLQGNTECLPLASGSVQRIICSEVLEHVPSPAAALGELARILAPGGRMALSVPTPFSEVIYRLSSDEYFNSPGGHVRILSLGAIRKLLEGAGLELTDLHFEHGFHTPYWWVRCVFGLHDEAHPLIRGFRKVLTHVLFSPGLTRLEGWFNWICPKSMVVYAQARGGPPVPAQETDKPPPAQAG